MDHYPRYLSWGPTVMPVDGRDISDERNAQDFLVGLQHKTALQPNCATSLQTLSSYCSPSSACCSRCSFPQKSCPSDLEMSQVAKVQQMSAMRSRLERDFLDSLPGKSVLQLREHLTAKLAALREQAAAVISELPAEEVRQAGLRSQEEISILSA